MESTHYDLIIVGSGAGGGTLAYVLADTGKKILILERGGFLRRSKDNWDAYKIFRDQLYNTPERWLDAGGKEFRPKQYYFVGGLTKFYGATVIRFRREDFGEVRHVDGISPAWPIDYEDMEPYYAEAERLYLAHGLRGEDPTEPPASGPYPHPPISHEPRIQEISDGLAALGLHPFHLPLGIMLNESDRDNSPCIRCDTCDGFACLLDAKADAETVCVRPALKHGNVTLMTNTEVTRLETAGSGRSVSSVEAVRNGEPLRFKGDVVVLSAGAINSAVLLLRSRSDKHPDGLANSSGRVGRNVMFHNNCAMLALTPFRKNPTVFPKTLCVNDFYFNDPFDPDYGYPLGDIQLLGNLTKETLKAVQPIVPMPMVKYIAEHIVSFWQSTEDLPLPDNRVEVLPDGRVRVGYRTTNGKSLHRLVARSKQILKRLGYKFFLTRRSGPETVGHQCGTVRFGADPSTSVLDPFCKAHDLENLYVVDSGFFPSSTALNPTLTVSANALRVADHLKGIMK